jgi:1,2-diacylglycerol 3-beta-glucosyltransferase
MDVVVVTLNTAAAVVVMLSLTYFGFLLLAGFREIHRGNQGLAVQGGASYGHPFLDDPNSFDTYVLIACLNESAVIGATVLGLHGGARNTTIIIDDGSDDDTAAVARLASDRNTIVLRREQPDARRGKGEALNFGFTEVRRLVAERGQDPERVVVVVMDADGRLSDGAFSHTLPMFEDPHIGGLQLAVRIRNRNTNFLTRFQDFQFWSMASLSQFGRSQTGTVSLGGNGQFTRFSALDELGAKPWSSSLTEDLDLAVTLVTRGWKLDTTPLASVDQEGVTELRKLFVQRRRWYQGHMMTTKRVGQVWSTAGIKNSQALEMSAYLLMPWLIDLPWSLLWQWNLTGYILRAGSSMPAPDHLMDIAVGAGLWYLLAFAPTIVTIIVHLRRDNRHSLGNAIVLGHSFLIMNYLFFACAWAAFFRILRGRRGWDKTKRVAEATAPKFSTT